MAEVEKFNDSSVLMLLKHAERHLKNDSNKDIIEKKSDLNYSILIDRNGLTPRQFYKKIKVISMAGERKEKPMQLHAAVGSSRSRNRSAIIPELQKKI